MRQFISNKLHEVLEEQDFQSKQIYFFCLPLWLAHFHQLCQVFQLLKIKELKFKKKEGRFHEASNF